MKGNEISVKELRADAVEWLTKLHQTMLVKDYGKGSVRNYCQEMRLLFKYYSHKSVTEIQQADIEQYLQYIKEVHKVGRVKCRTWCMLAVFSLSVYRLLLICPLLFIPENNLSCPILYAVYSGSW